MRRNNGKIGQKRKIAIRKLMNALRSLTRDKVPEALGRCLSHQDYDTLFHLYHCYQNRDYR